MHSDSEQKDRPRARHFGKVLSSVRFLRAFFSVLSLLCLVFALVLPSWLQGMEGKVSPRWFVSVQQMLPIAWLINGVLLAGISFSVTWWLQPWKVPVKEEQTSVRSSRTSYFLLAVIMLYALVLNAPRLKQSLWGDEEWTMRHNVVGDFRVTNEDKLKFNPVSWGEAVYRYLTPNNHGFFSLLSKASHEVFYRNRNAPEALYFSESAMRLPSLLAGLLALLIIYKLMEELGFPRAGVIAAILLALHPWFVRYSTEARGYGLLFALWPLALLMLLRGLRTGEWCWWISYGLCQWLLLWTWMPQIHWVIAMNVAALACLWRRHDDPRHILFRRWLLGCLIGAMLALPSLLPAVPQILSWMQGERAMSNETPWVWCGEAASWLLTGQGWHTPRPVSPYCLGRDLEWPALAFRLVLEFAVPSVLLIVGLFGFAIRSHRHRWALLAMLLPYLTVFLQSAITGNLLLPWYASPLLPAVIMLMALGIEKASALSGRRWSWLVASAMIVAPGTIWWHECSLLRAHDLESIRAATQLTREVLNPRLIDLRHGPITVQFCLPRQGYDPACVTIKQSSELEMLISRARGEHRSLFVHLGDVPMARLRWPEIMALVDDQSLFESQAILYGLDHAQTRQVWKLK